MKHCRLGVNVDHAATLRNARGGDHPDPVHVADAALAGGADGITVHLREDRRHINDDDLRRMRSIITAPINLEMAATPAMTSIAMAVRPHACCIVPERRIEVTTEGGLDAAGQFDSLQPIVDTLRDAGIRVSLFIEPAAVQLQAASALGVAAIELHTGAYALGRKGELDRLRAAASQAAELGLECHAGHGLTYDNVAAIAAIPTIAELNIGHFLIGEALRVGLPDAVKHMVALIAEARR
jgi:pyridoxine 5-phosphate synthase